MNHEVLVYAATGSRAKPGDVITVTNLFPPGKYKITAIEEPKFKSDPGRAFVTEADSSDEVEKLVSLKLLGIVPERFEHQQIRALRIALSECVFALEENLYAEQAGNGPMPARVIHRQWKVTERARKLLDGQNTP